jgi:hypothetical protein
MSKLISAHLISGEMIPGTEIGLKLIKYYCKMLLVMSLEAFNLKKQNQKLPFSMSITTCFKRIGMDDHLFCNRRQHVLDSGSAELEGLVMLCTWNDLADQAKHFWVRQPYASRR